MGCKVNAWDTAALITEFKNLGYQIVDTPDQADVSLLNSCTVTSRADQEGRALLRRFKRSNPGTKVVATGCYAQTDSARLMAMDEVDYVVPNSGKKDLAGWIHAQLTARPDGTPRTDLTPPGMGEKPREHFKTALHMTAANTDQTRAYLKVQDGCNGFCSYCIIPWARGASRSVESGQVLAEVRRLTAAGYREIILTGIHLGDYGADHDDPGGLHGLLKAMLELPGSFRIRLSSLEPGEVDEPTLALLATAGERFCHHFHLPLQSGHDRILKQMRRTYDTSTYGKKVKLIRSYFPQALIAADVIPGFPGETAGEHQATMDFINDTRIDDLHVFPYSRRPGTMADRLPGHLHPREIRERAGELRRLGAGRQTAWRQSFAGAELTVLWEKRQDKAGRIIGRTGHYLEVVSCPDLAVPGEFSRVRLRPGRDGVMEGIPTPDGVQQTSSSSE